jgi:hypothetical protein
MKNNWFLFLSKTTLILFVCSELHRTEEAAQKAEAAQKRAAGI